MTMQVKLIGAGIGLLVLLGAATGIYFKGQADGIADCNEEAMKSQAAANFLRQKETEKKDVVDKTVTIQVEAARNQAPIIIREALASAPPPADGKCIDSAGVRAILQADAQFAAAASSNRSSDSLPTPLLGP